MAKQLNVSLAFSADTSKAKAQLQDLQRQLTNLTNSTGSIANSQGMGITKQLHEASMAAAQLKVQLQDATNVNTGKLDLVKFNQSLKASGMDLQQYKTQLMALGPAGAQAFSGLAAAVTNAEAPIFRVSTRVRELGTVLKNTVRWQISSSLLHGFMGAIQGAYGYAKDLNESLNNIRIVTGQSTDQMAKFAKEANKAAKALSSTTTEYTDAALIYYQQGLSGEQVKERAEVTLKMANVSRQSAETVSQQMTSVWNNFYDGGKSLEYYSDVMVALGAATASSSDEIATGLEKFSAVSNTVGLSYEYAAAALATVTAQTRQSADTVGTAFRTLFTRLEGLNLGETAEDGTTLNKYSEALYKVGVNIKDQQGQLKDMDQILDELGAKWQTLGKEQQVALAQTVGGARQYATLIALMDNWDFFQTNLGTAKGAEGTLQEQADTYAESWEAARERVTASLQKIYGELLNDKFFISLNDSFAGFLDILGNVMDGLGGLKGVLLTIGTMLITVYQKQLANSLKNITASIYSWTSGGRKELDKLRDSASSVLTSMTGNNIGSLYKHQADVQREYINNVKLMNEEEQKRAKILMEQHGALAQQVIDTAKIIEEQSKQVKASSRKVDWQANLGGKLVGQSAALEAYRTQALSFSDDDLSTKTGIEQFNKQISNLKSTLSLDDILNNFGAKARKVFSDLFQQLEKGPITANAAKEALNELAMAEEDLAYKGNEYNEQSQKEADVVEKNTEAHRRMGQAIGENIAHQSNLKTQTEETIRAFQFSSQGIKDWAKNAVSFARNLGAVSMAMSSLISLGRTWNNESLSFGEKMLQTVQTLCFVLPAFLSLLEKENVATFTSNTLNAIKNKTLLSNISLSVKSNIVKLASLEMDKKDIAQTSLLIILKKALQGGLLKTIAAMLKWVAIAGLLILAATGIVKIFKLIKEQTPEEQLKKAKEETERCAKAAQAANNAYSELLDTLNGFDSAYDKIASLTKGTLEWKQAVNDLNNDINELIKQYPELAEYVITNSDGVKSITAEGKEWLNETEQKKVNAINNASLIAESNERNVNLNKEKYDIFGMFNHGLASYVNQAAAAGVVDITNTDSLKAAGLNDFQIKSLQNHEKEAQEYLDLSAKDKLSDQLDAETFLAQDENFWDKVYGEDAIVPENLRQAVVDVAGEQFNARVQHKISSGVDWRTMDTELLDAYAKANGYEYDAKEQEFYSLNDKNERDEKVTDDIQGNLRQWTAVQQTLAEGIELTDGLLSSAEARKSKQYQVDANIFETERTNELINSFDSDETEAYKASLEWMRDNLPEIEKEFEDVEGGAEKMYQRLAAAQVAFNRGFEDVLDNYEEYYDALQESNKGTLAYTTALKKMKQNYSDMLDLDVSEEFITNADNLELMKEAAEGNLEAITQLRENAATDIVSDVELNDSSFQSTLDFILAQIQNSEEFESLEIGATLEDQEFIDALMTMLDSANMSVEEIQKVLNSLGFEPEIQYVDVPINEAAYDSTTSTYTYTDPVTGEERTTKVESELQADQNGMLKMPLINGSKITYKGNPNAITNSANKAKAKDNSKGSKKDKKKAADEIERYHVVKEQLEDIEQELDRISKAKDRAFGGDKLKLMDDEIAKTQELLDKEQEYFDQINANYGPDRKALEAYGAKFDANGALINYDSLMNAQINAFNSSLSDEAEENYENFKELIDQYEETDDLLAEQRQKLIDLQNEMFDLMLEKLEYEVTLKIDVNEDANKYLDFLMEMNGDGMDHALDNIDALGEKIANGMEDIETYTNGLNNMFKNRGYKGNVVEDLQSGKVTPEELAEMYDLTEAEVDLMREYMGNIMDTTKEIQNMRKEITDQLIDAMEEINEKFDEQIDKINRAAEGMQHYRDIIDLVGQDVLGISDEMVEMFSEKQLNNSIANVSATRTKMLENEREYNEAVAELERLKDTGASEFAIEEQERVVKAAREHLYTSTDEFNSAWKDALEQAREHFDLTIEQITSAFEEAMSGIYGNLEALQDAYDRQSEINERYLEDYEKIYELSKLNRDIGNSIDNTDSIRAKQALLELQEEINALEESGAEISKYDLDFLRQKYELRLAEIALEEAQNAKSQVRMTRDSEGNWNYTYTANEENISKAEQDYEDALYKTQQLTTDYIKDLENRIFQLNTDLVNALSSVDPNDAEGRQRIYDYYMGQNNYLTSQLNNALGNNADLYNQDWMSYSNATGYKISDNEKWMDSFNETTLSMLTGYSSLGDYQNAFRDSSLLMYNSINDAASEFATNTEAVMNAAGTSIETFAEDAEEAFKNFSISTKEATDNIDGIDKEAKETFDAILEKLVKFNKAYDEQIQQTIKANQDLIKSFNDLIAKEAEAKKSSGKSSNSSSTSNNTSTTPTTSPSTPKPETPTTTNWVYTGEITAYRDQGYGYYARYERMNNGKKEYDFKFLRPISSPSAAAPKGGGGVPKAVIKMDTGGYTGAWGTTAGKLAMLHEKELVLNKQDTENILQSVNLVRQISDWISGRVNAMQYGSMLSAFGLPGDNKNVLEQMVTIHAEFPNANNRAEIEAAFDNLVNRAAQYAYRK